MNLSINTQPVSNEINNSKNIRIDILIYLLLAALVFGIYGGNYRHDYINFKDNDTITENVHFQNSLTVEDVKWALTSTETTNWQPITWLSHFWDFLLFGNHPGGHHVTSMLIHLANAILLFSLLKYMTGSVWKSAIVALLFAVHPLHVESVSWISARKDVLGAFFMMLTLLAYGKYCERPGKNRYGLVMIMFALGVMSNPLLITLPFLMLLLDYWPLGRFYAVSNEDESMNQDHSREREPFILFVVEKAPLILMSIGFGIAAVIVQIRNNVAQNVLEFPIGNRIANAFVSYLLYAVKTVWPIRLSVYYPSLGEQLTMLYVLLAGLLLLALTVCVIRWRRNIPYVFTGWLWFLLTCLPVIGIVQIGFQSFADSYTYVTIIGLFIAVVWGVSGLVGDKRIGKILVVMITIPIILSLSYVARTQAGHWENSGSLFTHALSVTDGNDVAHLKLGIFLDSKGKSDEAIVHYRDAIALNPENDIAHSNLANALVMQNRGEEALEHYKNALRINPYSPIYHNNLGAYYDNLGNIKVAIASYSQAVRLKPDYYVALNNMGMALVRIQKIDEGIKYISEAIRLQPNYVKAHFNLGTAYSFIADYNKAAESMAEAVRLEPEFTLAQNKLGILLTHIGRYDEAIEHLNEALRLNPNYYEPQVYLDRIREMTLMDEADDLNEVDDTAAAE